MVLKLVITLIVGLISTSTLAEENLSDHVMNTHQFKNIAVQEQSVSRADGKQVANKILISHYTKNLKKRPGLNFDDNQTIDEPFWVIEAKDLPAADACIDHMLDDCEDMEGIYQGITCNKCLTYGANFLAFNEQTQKLYVISNSTDMGNEDGHVMVFEADINNKNIAYVGTFEGPMFEAKFSPDNKFLAMSARGWITIVNTNNKESFEYIAQAEPKGQDMIYHFTSNIKWKNNTQFTFDDSETLDERFGDIYKTTTKLYDVDKKEVVAIVSVKNNDVATKKADAN